MITCADAVRQLWRFLDATLEPADRARVEEHLAFCRTCCGEMEFAQELQRFLAEQGGADEVPGEVRERLERFVQELGR